MRPRQRRQVPARQLLELCCTSVDDDEFAPKKGHTEYKVALVANYKALLSADEDDDTMPLKLPPRISGIGWPYINNTLVYELDRFSPSGSNISALRDPGQLPQLLTKTSGELLVLLVHGVP